MSRSRHKHPHWVDRSFKKWGKIFAKRKIRRLGMFELSNGAHYKRFYQQYDICDYCWVVFKDQEGYDKATRK